MKSYFNRLNIKHRLLLLLAVPILGLLAFVASSLIDHLKEVKVVEKRLNNVTELSALATATRDVLDALQFERTIAVILLSNLDNEERWEAAHEDFKRQIRRTDPTIQQFRKTLGQYDFSNYGEGMVRAIENLKPHLDSYDEKRVLFQTTLDTMGQLGLTKPPTPGHPLQSTTGLFENLIGIIDQTASLTDSVELDHLIRSYAYLLRTKEDCSKVQAILYPTFRKDKFQGVFFNRFLNSHSASERNAAIFSQFATPESNQFYFEAISPEQNKSYRDLTAAATSSIMKGLANFGVDPDQWMRVSTSRLDSLRTVEDHLSEKILESVDTIKKANSGTFYWLLALAVGIIVVSVAISILIAKSTVSSINHSIEELNDGSHRVADASSVVTESSSAMAGTAEEQSAAMSETAASLESINELLHKNTELTSQTSRTTQDASSQAQTCLNQMEQMNEAMQEIRDASDAISAIIKIIDEIAFQTNILALNAAVEAARAGEAGAGFAVVADEVRGLAQRSAQAASDSSNKIKDSIEKSQKGGEICTLVDASLREIVSKVEEIDGMVAQVSNSSEQQKESIESINIAVKEQERGISEVTASSEETAVSAEELQNQSKRMREAVVRLSHLAGTDAKTLAAPSAPIQRHVSSLRETFDLPNRGASQPKAATPATADQNDVSLWN